MTTSESTVSSTTTNVTHHPPAHEGDELPLDVDPIEYEAGAIAGVVFGVLVCIVISVTALILYKRKRARDREYQRTANIHKSSARSAGVYQDTTTEDLLVPPGVKVKSHGAEYKSLEKNKNLYESDSSEEL